MAPVNQPMFDRYSTAHAGFGVTFAALGIPFWAAAVISIAFELFENKLKDTFPAAFPFASHDSVLNTVGDTISLLAGHALAAHVLNRGATPAEQAALQATVAATVTGFVTAVLAGSTSTVLERQLGKQAANWGDQGFRAGSALGGSYGAWRAGAPDMSVVTAVAGGYLGGPVGAGLAAYAAGKL